jgi:hypothetical protein
MDLIVRLHDDAQIIEGRLDLGSLTAIGQSANIFDNT